MELANVRLTSHTRYPWSSVLLYEGMTVVHFALGGLGIFLGFSTVVGSFIAGLYLLFAFVEMYLLMPLRVCPNCVYYRTPDARCVSALNLVARRFAKAGDSREFASRAAGPLCPNNLYLAALIAPIIAVIVALVLGFSWLVAVICLVIVVLLVVRFFVVFPKVACGHCLARHVCPNAQAMGLSDK